MFRYVCLKQNRQFCNFYTKSSPSIYSIYSVFLQSFCGYLRLYYLPLYFSVAFMKIHIGEIHTCYVYSGNSSI